MRGKNASQRLGADNIRSVYESATAEELSYGLSWYQRANEQAARLAFKHSVDLDRAVGVIAALSPATTWQRNLEDADTVLRAAGLKHWRPSDITISSYGLNKKKAWRIAKGEPRWKWLKGLKVNSFYSNIRWPEVSQEVTVDGHTYSIWAGERHQLQGHDTGELPQVPSRVYRNPTYGRIAEDYRRVAQELELKPHQVQAVCWLAWRRMHEVLQRKGEERLYKEVAA